MDGSPDIAASNRPIVGVSSCLLGNEVRYDGGHKLNRFISEELARYCELEAYCPEVSIGMGIPRPPIRLVVEYGVVKALGVDKADLDATTPLREYGREVARRIEHLSGFVFKQGSPSCGVAGVPVFDTDGSPVTEGSGLFTAEIVSVLPLLPVIDETRLDNPELRADFIAQVQAHHRRRG